MGKQSPVRILYKVSLGLQPYRMMKWNMKNLNRRRNDEVTPALQRCDSTFISSYSLYLRIIYIFMSCYLFKVLRR